MVPFGVFVGRNQGVMKRNLAEWVRTRTEKSNDRLFVLDVSDGDPAVMGRLGDLGFIKDEPFDFFGRAPLGEPIFICVRETVVALRIEEARLILICDRRSADGGPV
jgi:Fe2+ transport system protein FeoA